MTKKFNAKNQGAKDVSKEWLKKAAEKLSKQQLNEGDFIWIRGKEYVGKRARIVELNVRMTSDIIRFVSINC